MTMYEFKSMLYNNSQERQAKILSLLPSEFVSAFLEYQTSEKIHADKSAETAAIKIISETLYERLNS